MKNEGKNAAVNAAAVTTNVMRQLERFGIAYKSYFYEVPAEVPSGAEVARMLGLDPDRVFKTLVTLGHSGEHYVFMIPVEAELDLKKAAAAVKEKNIEMLKMKELLPLTGYIHGGCSPIGMKKRFTTAVDETAMLFDTIVFSAGRVGAQVELAPEELSRVIGFHYADLTVS